MDFCVSADWIISLVSLATLHMTSINTVSGFTGSAYLLLSVRMCSKGAKLFGRNLRKRDAD